MNKVTHGELTFVSMVLLVGMTAMVIVLMFWIGDLEDRIDSHDNRIKKLQTSANATTNTSAACQLVLLDGTNIVADPLAQPQAIVQVTHGEKIVAIARYSDGEQDWVEVSVPNMIPSLDPSIVVLGWVPLDRVIGFFPQGCEAVLPVTQ